MGANARRRAAAREAAREAQRTHRRDGWQVILDEMEPDALLPGEQRINAYVCDDCRAVTVTVDRHEGVTPMFLACRALGEPNSPGNPCKGRGVSSMYELRMLRHRLAELGVAELPDEWPAPTWEWYKPSATAVKRMLRDEPATAEHCRKGGLMLRRIEA